MISDPELDARLPASFNSEVVRQNSDSVESPGTIHSCDFGPVSPQLPTQSVAVQYTSATSPPLQEHGQAIQVNNEQTHYSQNGVPDSLDTIDSTSFEWPLSSEQAKLVKHFFSTLIPWVNASFSPGERHQVLTLFLV